MHTTLLLAAVALAGSFDVTPDTLVLGKPGTLTITNTGADPIRVQATALIGESPTADLVISPSQVTVPAGRTRVLRVTPKRAVAEHEVAYRVVLEEPHLGLARASVPVFLAGSAAPMHLGSLAVDLREGSLQVDVANAGNAHFRYYELGIVGESADEVPEFWALRRRGVLLAGDEQRET
ncbi:MAG: molecular chaperone, partial [Deltaproteobacteria bacterium]|nr:molecular chaperone [Deltaproteobacteria bacterium]